MNTSIEIESQDVLRTILQFLKEQNLMESMKALQKESGIALNTIDNIESFRYDILHGKWDSVLTQTASLNLPIEKLIFLYEQIVLELLEVSERELAKNILRSSEPLMILKSKHLERYLKLEELCKRNSVNESDLYEMGSTKEYRRREIADSLLVEVSVVQPSRLLALLGQALKYQQSQNLLQPDQPFDLFRNARKQAQKDMEEKYPRYCLGDLQSSKGSKLDSLAFSYDGQSIITGTIDGLIENFDAESLKLNMSLEYQMNGNYMQLDSRDDPVLCTCISKDNDLVASGTKSGQLYVFKISTGICSRKFLQAHPQGITSVCFSRDNTQILTTSFDQTARIHGMKSGKTLKEFRGHTSYVNSGVYLKDISSNGIVTGSADGTVKVWDLRTTECLLTFRPGASIPGATITREFPINTIQLVPNNNNSTASDQLFICTNSSNAYIMTTGGMLVKKFSTGQQSNANSDFTCATISPQGRYIYCVGEDRILYIFDTKTGQLEHTLPIKIDNNNSTSNSVSGHINMIVHHPLRNLIATVSSLPNEGILLWKP